MHEAVRQIWNMNGGREGAIGLCENDEGGDLGEGEMVWLRED